MLRAYLDLPDRAKVYSTAQANLGSDLQEQCLHENGDIFNAASSTRQARSRFSPGHWTKRDGHGLGLLDDANKEVTDPENALSGSTDKGLVGLSLEAPNHNSRLGYNQTKTQQQEPSTAYNHANLLAWMAHHPANRGQPTLCIRISMDQP